MAVDEKHRQLPQAMMSEFSPTIRSGTTEIRSGASLPPASGRTMYRVREPKYGPTRKPCFVILFLVQSAHMVALPHSLTRREFQRRLAAAAVLPLAAPQPRPAADLERPRRLFYNNDGSFLLYTTPPLDP